MLSHIIWKKLKTKEENDDYYNIQGKGLSTIFEDNSAYQKMC